MSIVRLASAKPGWWENQTEQPVAASSEMLPHITYEVYCECLSGLSSSTQLTASITRSEAGLFDWFKNTHVVRDLVKVFKEIGAELQRISAKIGVGMEDLIAAFKSKNVYQVLKSVRFSIGLIWKAFKAASSVVSKSMLVMFKEIAETGVVQQLKAGTLKADEFLRRYPLLKKISGIVLAGILLYIWINVAFIGDFDYDFDLADIPAALSGAYSFTDLLASPNGLMMLSLMALFMGTGISLSWMVSDLTAVLIAIVYTGFRDAKKWSLADRFKKLIKRSSGSNMPIIKLVSAKPGWWENQSAKQRHSYLARHPKSRYGARGLAPPAEHKPNKPLSIKQAQRRKVKLDAR